MTAKIANLRWWLVGMMLPLTCVAAPPTENLPSKAPPAKAPPAMAPTAKAPPAKAPPADFWQFFDEFADDRGELLDPKELDTLAANGIDANGLDAMAKMPVNAISPDSATEEETP